MARDLYQLIFEGNLGQTPELRHTNSGTPVCDLNVAVDRSYTDDGGERVDNTHWMKVVAWGRQAETCAQYLEKGRRVRVTVGRVGSEAWVSEANNELRHRPVFHANTIDFLPGGKRAEAAATEEVAAIPEPAAKAQRQRRKKATRGEPAPVGVDLADFTIEDIPF